VGSVSVVAIGPASPPPDQHWACGQWNAYYNMSPMAYQNTLLQEHVQPRIVGMGNEWRM
jgi:hypothetical protein